ncbi:PAS domain S-box protein, partial [Candidatus Latescibacterota bacterium]
MRRAKILIVEDEVIVADDIKKILGKNGYDVASLAISGEKAIQIVAEENPDLVLMDIFLKGKLNGIKAADYIHKKFKIPVIYLTAYYDEKTFQSAKITRPFGYLTKPFDTRQLCMAIEIALYKNKIDKEKEKLIHDLQKEITERKQAEEDLSKSEERFRSLFESSPEFIHILDKNGTILQTNPAVTQVLGYIEEEVIGRPLSVFLTPTSQKILAKDLPVLIKKGTHRSEVEFICKDGKVIITDCSCMVVLDSQGEFVYIVTFLRDITERKQAE